MVAETWEWFPFTMLMVLASLQMIRRRRWRPRASTAPTTGRRSATSCFPYIQQTLVVAGIFRLIDSIKAFPLIFVLTDGGPGDVTEVTNYYAYRQAFTFSLWGYGSAIATLMVVGIFVLSWVIDRLTGAADAEARSTRSRVRAATANPFGWRARAGWATAAPWRCCCWCCFRSSGWCRCRSGRTSDILGYELAVHADTGALHARCGPAHFPARSSTA